MTDTSITNQIIDEFDRLAAEDEHPSAIDWLDCLNADITGREWAVTVRHAYHLLAVLRQLTDGPYGWEATEARFVLATRVLAVSDNPLLSLFRNARDERPIRERAAEALDALGGPNANDEIWTRIHPKVELLFDARTVLHGLAGPAAR